MIKLQDIIYSSAALQELAATPLRPVVAFRIAKATKFLNGEVTDFEAARKQLLEEFGEKDEAGKLVTSAEGNVKLKNEGVEFRAAFKALLEEPVELPPSVRKSKITEFDAPLKPAVLMALEWLIEDEV